MFQSIISVVAPLCFPLLNKCPSIRRAFPKLFTICESSIMKNLSPPALSARGVHKLRSFEEDRDTVYDNNTYIITSTWHNGHLQIYASKPIDPESPPEDHMTQLRSFAMIDTAERFREGGSCL